MTTTDENPVARAVPGPAICPAEGLVARRIYRDPEILRLEQRQIFRRTWQFACLVRDVAEPGEFHAVTVADLTVIVVREEDGRLRAFSPSGTRPASTVSVPCETFADLVFVALDPVVSSLKVYLGVFGERLAPYVDGIETIGRNSWIYAGNWKLWHENFRDNYHPEFTHRFIHDMSPHYADAGGNWGFDEGHSVLQWAGPRAPSARSYLRNVYRLSGVRIEAMDQPGERQDRQGAPDEVLAAFPNADFQPRATIEDRGRKAGFIQTVTPLGVDRARVDLLVYSSVDDDAETRREMLETVADTQGSWGKISTDDTEAMRRVQLGMAARGTGHNLFTRGDGAGFGGADAQSRDEYSQRAFYRAYRRYLSQ